MIALGLSGSEKARQHGRIFDPHVHTARAQWRMDMRRISGKVHGPLLVCSRLAMGNAKTRLPKGLAHSGAFWQKTREIGPVSGQAIAPGPDWDGDDETFL